MAVCYSLRLVELIRERNFNQLREILVEFPLPDIAEILPTSTPKTKPSCCAFCRTTLAADVFEYLSLEDQERLVQALGTEHVAQILNEIQPDDRTALLEELPGPVTQKLLNLLSAGRTQNRLRPARLSERFHRPAHDAGLYRDQK